MAINIELYTLSLAASCKLYAAPAAASLEHYTTQFINSINPNIGLNSNNNSSHETETSARRA